MHPYRDAALPTAPTTDDTDDQRALGAVLVVVGLVPVIGAVVAGAAFGAEPTVGLLLAALGAVTALRRR